MFGVPGLSRMRAPRTPCSDRPLRTRLTQNTRITNMSHNSVVLGVYPLQILRASQSCDQRLYNLHKPCVRPDLSLTPISSRFLFPDSRAPSATVNMVKVTLNGTVLAESDKTVVVEGNHYFPPDSVNAAALSPSSTQ